MMLSTRSMAQASAERMELSFRRPFIIFFSKMSSYAVLLLSLEQSVKV